MFNNYEGVKIQMSVLSEGWLCCTIYLLLSATMQTSDASTVPLLK